MTPAARIVLGAATLLAAWVGVGLPARAERTLTAATLRDWPPQYGTDDAGKPRGFAIDVMNAVARRAGYDVRYRTYPDFDEALQALERGEVDVLPNVGITSGRQERFIFTSPIETFNVSVFVRRTSGDLRTLDDLEGHVVAVVRTNVAVGLLRARPGVETRTYENVHRALFDLLSGQVDGLAYPEPVVLKMAEDTGLEDRIRALSPALIEVKRAIALRRDHTALRHELDAAVRSVLASPEYPEIFRRWYGAQGPFWTAPRVVLTALVVLLVLVGAFLVWRRRALLSLGRAEAARHKSELRYRHLMEEASDGVLLFSVDARVVDANQTAASMLGYSRQELLGRHAADLIDPEDVARHPLQFGEMQSGDRLLVERILVRADGTKLPAEVSVRRVGDMYLGIVRDISARKAAQEESRLREERLHDSQKLEALGRLAGGVAHDFNNLLTAIFGNAEMLLAGLPAPNPAHADVKEIRDAAKKGKQLTEQLLAFSRRQVRKPEWLDFDAVVRDMERILRRIAGENVAFELDLRSGGGVEGDRSQIEQMLLNLVINAKDAQPNGGAITGRTSCVQIPEDASRGRGAKRAGAHVLLEVRDEGEGVDAATRARMFEPFFTTKPRGKGTGLGLSIVHSVVAQADGFIETESEPGHGLTIRVFLPQSERLSGVESAHTPPPQAPPDRQQGTVLVAEDDAMVRRLAARVLRLAGWSVQEAASGAEAIELVNAADASDVDVLVTDVVMPGMSGPELAKALARDRPDLAVLFMSGYTDQHLDATILEADDRAFLAKPFRPDELAAKVAELAEVARRVRHAHG